MQNNNLTMFGVDFDYLYNQITRYQTSYSESKVFFNGGDDLNLLSDYVSDVKIFKFRNYMGINPYDYARGSSFGYYIKGAEVLKTLGLFLAMLILWQ